MLKISDDIEFEKLNKWGFKINKNTLPPCIYIDDDICQMYFDLDTKRLAFINYGYDLFYDLIICGIIVKEAKNEQNSWRGTKLKEFEKSYGKRHSKLFTQTEIVMCNMILDKIRELENETANNCNDCKQCKESDSNE